MRASPFKPHPWHGLVPGEDVPHVVTAYIEMVPSDTVKYEIDKLTGYLKVDRPQRFSSLCPTLYGFIPRTYSGEAVGELCRRATGRSGIRGDGDPLDICVLTERSFSHGDFLVRALPLGGLRILDAGEADDKILAVLEGDAAFSSWRDIGDCPEPLLERLQHYFLTYKQAPEAEEPEVEMAGVYGRDEAHDLIRRSLQDYCQSFGELTRG